VAIGGNLSIASPVSGDVFFLLTSALATQVSYWQNSRKNICLKIVFQVTGQLLSIAISINPVNAALNVKPQLFTKDQKEYNEVRFHSYFPKTDFPSFHRDHLYQSCTDIYQGSKYSSRQFGFLSHAFCWGVYRGFAPVAW
jgi:hypothetical protein